MKHRSHDRPFFALVAIVAAATLALGATACDESSTSSTPGDPSAGPGELVDERDPMDTATFRGGNDTYPAPRAGIDVSTIGRYPACGPDCENYCASLGLENPVNAGVCPVMWGAGLQPRPVVVAESCRRLFVDTLGRAPTHEEVLNTCEGKPWGDVVQQLLNTEEFILVNQRRWADKLMYNNQAISISRIYDMDNLVGKLYRGEISYDQFAITAATHPVLTRRYDTPGDRAEAVFWLFLGRPPLGSERSDMARLYNLWFNGYYDHPEIGARLPDAHIRFECIDENGQVDDLTKGECTSVLWGYNEVIMEPDVRAVRDEDGNLTMWSGVLRPDEWDALQVPGRILSQQPEFWETAVDDVLYTYLGYRIGIGAPSVRDELVRYVLDHDGDIRAAHYAVLTSIPYLQSTVGQSPTEHRWTYGPLKQMDVEPWIDSITRTTGHQLSYCDHRIPRPGDLVETGSVAAFAILNDSRWMINDEGEVDGSYRSLARALGGCPANDVGTRFKTVSILTTATQIGHVANVCNPPVVGTDVEAGGVDATRLMPGDIGPQNPITEDNAARIVDHQMRQFLSRPATDTELAEARGMIDGTHFRATQIDTSEAFARSACFAILSSAENLFY